MHILYKLLAICLFLFGSITGVSQDLTPPEKGILDLRDYNFNEQSLIKLNGEWEFYWQEFVSPLDLKSSDPPSPTLFGKVPGYWIDYSNEDISFTGNGYGSYRLRILLPEGFRQNIGFDMPVFDASAKVFFDGQEMYSAGLPGSSEELSEAGYQPATLFHRPATDTMEILLHVSNFQHRRGGFWKSMQIGHPDMILKTKQRHRLIGNISLGTLMAFSLFFFFFYLFYPKDKVVLAFSLIMAGVFVRMLNTELYSITYLFDISWIWIIRLEYLGTFLAFGAALWYFHRLFPAKYMNWIVRINTLIVIIAGVVILMFKVTVFSYTMLYFQPAVILVLVYYLIACIWAIYKGDRNKILFLAGLVIFLGGLINDILVANSVQAASKSYIIHFSLQIFVFIQAVLIIRNWIRAYIDREKLMGEVEYINKNLEALVDERTLEVNIRNREIQRKNEDIEARNKELKDALEFKSRVFSIIAHDLKSPVASLVQNSALLDYNLSKEENKKLLDSFRELSSSALNLIDNLLYWGRSQGSELGYNPELIDLKPIVEEVFKLFAEMSRLKNITLEWESRGESTVFADRELLEIVCRNILSNSIKFTEKGGKVNVKAGPLPESNKILLSVRDNGIGIPAERLSNIFGTSEMISTAGTDQERGTGIGLRLCNELVVVNKGELKIESKVGEGTTVSIILPAASD